MERVICHQCHALQPKNWKVGDLCINCGKAIRQEIRCYWCVRWTPKGKFCRECGSELVDDAWYGAARMLKNVGVDQFSLPKKLHELSPDQLDNFQRIYQKHYALVLEKIEEVKCCQKFLVQQDHDLRLEEKLLPLIPFTEENLTRFNSKKLSNLQEIYKNSTIASTRILAGLAMLRAGDFEQENQASELYQSALQALDEEDQNMQWEAAFALSHWRTRLEPFCFYNSPDWQKIAKTVRPALDIVNLQTWAAVASWPALLQNLKNNPDTADLDQTLEKNRLSEFLKVGLSSETTSVAEDLQLCAALCLADEQTLTIFLTNNDEAKQTVAALFLAQKKSTRLIPFLLQIKTTLLYKIVTILQNPLPADFVTALLKIIEHPDAQMVRSVFKLLEQNFDSEIISQMIDKASSSNNSLLFGLLLKSKYVDDKNKVLDASLKVSFDQNLGKSYVGLSENYEMPNIFIQKLDNSKDPEKIMCFINIAQNQLMRFAAPAYKQFLVETIFNSSDTKIIKEAIWALIRPQKFFVSTFQPVTFDSENLSSFNLQDFIAKLTTLLKNKDLLQDVGICEWMADFITSYHFHSEDLKQVHPSILNNFFEALFQVIQEDYWLNLRTSCARLIGKTAIAHPAPQKYITELEKYLHQNELFLDLAQSIQYAIDDLKKIIA